MISITLERFPIARVGFQSKSCSTSLKLLHMISIHTCGYGVDVNISACITYYKMVHYSAPLTKRVNQRCTPVCAFIEIEYTHTTRYTGIKICTYMHSVIHMCIGLRTVN